MPSYIQVSHQTWIAAPEPMVRKHLVDLPHLIQTQVHPGLHLELLALSFKRARYLAEFTVWGRRCRNMVVRECEPDETILDTVVEGPQRGATLSFGCTSSSVNFVVGTVLEVVARVPVPRGTAWALRPWVRAAVRAGLKRLAEEKKHDIEQLGYTPARAHLNEAA